MNWGPIVPIVVAALAPLGGYLLAARKMSGKIATSEAKDLWEEAARIREDCREQLRLANDRVGHLEGRVAKVESLNADLVEVNTRLLAKIDNLERLTKELRDTITHLEATIAAQRKELGQ